MTALPGGQRFETEAIDEMQGILWRPSPKHRGIKIRAHMTDEQDQGDDEKEESGEIQMETLRRSRGSRAISLSRHGMFCGHPGCLGCRHTTGEVATPSGHSKECKVRIMVEVEKDENKHRVSYVVCSKGIDEGEVFEKIA